MLLLSRILTAVKSVFHMKQTHTHTHNHLYTMLQDPVNTETAAIPEAPPETPTDTTPTTPAETVPVDPAPVAPAQPVPVTASTITPSQMVTPQTTLTPSHTAMSTLTPATVSIPFTQIVAAKPTRLEAVANDISAANAARLEAEEVVDLVRAEMARISAMEVSLNNQLVNAIDNVMLAKQKEASELRDAIQILQYRLDSLEIEIEESEDDS